MYICTINPRPQCFVGIDELLLVRRWRTMTWTSYQRLLCVIFQILFIVRIVSQSDSSSSGIHNFLKEQFDIFSLKRPEAVCWLSLVLNVRYDEMLSRVPTLRQGQWVVEKQRFLSLLTNLSSVRGGRHCPWKLFKLLSSMNQTSRTKYLPGSYLLQWNSAGSNKSVPVLITFNVQQGRTNEFISEKLIKTLSWVND